MADNNVLANNEALGDDKAVDTHSKDLSHHSVDDTVQLKGKGITNSTVSPRRNNKFVRVFAKNLLLLLVLIGLVQIVRKLALKPPGDYDSLEVVDKIICKEVEGFRSQLKDYATKLERLVARNEAVEKSLNELRLVVLLPQDDIDKRKNNELGESGVILDVIRDYATEIVQREIERHAADGLGTVDYALATLGGRVVKHSKAFSVERRNEMLLPSFGEPGRCFALQGSKGYVVIKLASAIFPQAVTLEHVAKSVLHNRSSAPKDCRLTGWIWGDDHPTNINPEKLGLLAEFTYDLEKSTVQTFDVAAFGVIDTVRLDIKSNHGNPPHTCIYRFRVHGYEPPSDG